MAAYVVSARKYRPQRFGEVVGQEQVTATLQNALKSNHLAQSFLFCGPRGVGKTTCARILAKAINCTDPSDDMEPCNTCSSCESFNAQSSFNIHELDAASNNSVDDIRSLNDQVRFAPQSGKYKVYIIDEVHMLSSAAFNAFLKTLEEPPTYAIFILATTEKHKIIPTILSRCQIFDFKRIVLKDIVSHLQYICKQEGVKADPAALHIIGQKADGALRDALSLFDKVASYSGDEISYKSVIENLNVLDFEYYFSVTDFLLVEDHTSLMLSFADVLSKGFEGDTFILGLAEHFRNLLLCKDEATLALLEASDDLAERYRRQAAIANDSFLLNALDIASSCESSYKTATNKRLHVEVALLKICFLSGVLQLDPPAIVESAKKKQPSSIDAGQLELVAPTVSPAVAKPEPKSEPKAQPEPSASQSRKEEKEEAPEISPAKTEAQKAPAAPAAETLKTEEAPKAQAAPEAEAEEVLPDKPGQQPDRQPSKQSEKVPAKEAAPPTAQKKAAPMDPLQELQAALSKGSFKGEATAKKEELPLTQESLEKAWGKFLVGHAAELPSNFISNAKALMPKLEKQNHIVLTTYSSVSRGFILDQATRVKEYLRQHFHRPDIALEVALEVEEEDPDKPKTYLNPKEQFNEMAKDNPALIDFQKRFDLDIDYDH